jgi:hypothetical protein
MMNKLLRRFSTTDLAGSESGPETPGPPVSQPSTGMSSRPSGIATSSTKNVSPSAPSSPTSGQAKLASFTSIMTAARDAFPINQVVNQVKSSTSSLYQRQQQGPTSQRGGVKVLLVLGDSNVDWAKYFRGRKLLDFEIRVEQAEFKDINLAAYTDTGAMCDIFVDRNGNKLVK